MAIHVRDLQSAERTSLGYHHAGRKLSHFWLSLSGFALQRLDTRRARIGQGDHLRLASELLVSQKSRFSSQRQMAEKSEDPHILVKRLEVAPSAFYGMSSDGTLKA